MNTTNRIGRAGMIGFGLFLSVGLTPATTFGEDAPAAQISLTIDAAKPAAPVSPTFYGMMTEEINHSYDGGLYGELVQNRVFKDNLETPVHWALVQVNGAAATMALDDNQPLNTNLPVSLRLEVTAATGSARAGVANDGYWGIPVMAHTKYHASFYAKTAGGAKEEMTVAIESKDGSHVYAKARVSLSGGDWQKYAVTLKTGGVTPTDQARLVLSVGQPGTVWLELVSLFPPTWHNRPNGNRVDLMQKLADMKPTFLRFPGGNFLEGDHIEDHFPWKQTLGDLTNRPGHAGCWGYRATDGMGLLEFLEWAEDLKAQPVLAVFAGYSLKGEVVQPGADLEPIVQDDLDEIEYVSGGTNTTWGARRAADGHPAPFKLNYVEIGNEDWFDRSRSYDARFAQIYDAIKAKYPGIQCISTAGNEQPERLRVHSRRPDVVDEHYYRPAAAFETEGPVRFEKYDRSGPKIFVGEWAAYEKILPWDKRSQKLPPTPSMRAALGDACWMAAMERNADMVVLNCYAPMLVNVNPGARQWRPNLIGYDGLNSFGSPSYYAIQMFSQHLGDVVLHASLNGLPTNTMAPLDYAVTKDTATGMIFVKVVNVTSTSQTMNIHLDGVASVSKKATVVTLSGDPEETNSLHDPTHLAPVTSKISKAGTSFAHTFGPYSITVLELKAR